MLTSKAKFTPHFFDNIYGFVVLNIFWNISTLGGNGWTRISMKKLRTTNTLVSRQDCPWDFCQCIVQGVEWAWISISSLWWKEAVVMTLNKQAVIHVIKRRGTAPTYSSTHHRLLPAAEWPPHFLTCYFSVVSQPWTATTHCSSKQRHEAHYPKWPAGLYRRVLALEFLMHLPATFRWPEKNGIKMRDRNIRLNKQSNFRILKHSPD